METLMDIINLEKIADNIFNDIQERKNQDCNCPSCNNHVDLTNNNDKYIKCERCEISFENPNKSILSLKIKPEKIHKLITCMIRDFTLEETMKFIDSNAESIKKNWVKLYKFIDWSKYNLQVRSEPITRIYANFEVILS